MSEFIPSQAPSTPALTQTEQDIKTGSSLAIAAFVTSLVTLFFTAGFFSFIGSILGHVSLSKLKKAGSDQNRGLAVAGVIIGWVSTGLAWLFLIGFIIAVIGISASSDASWWQDLVKEINANFKSI
jgi:hypothetical protein